MRNTSLGIVIQFLIQFLYGFDPISFFSKEKLDDLRMETISLPPYKNQDTVRPGISFLRIFNLRGKYCTQCYVFVFLLRRTALSKTVHFRSYTVTFFNSLIYTICC